MRNRFRFLVLFMVITVVFALALVGCEKKKPSGVNKQEETETVKQLDYNASDVAVVIKKDLDEGRITLKSGETGAVYSVNYNGGTKFKSKYGNDMLVENVKIGMVVEAYYIEGTRKLVEMMVCDEAWENTMAVRWDVDYDKKIITIGQFSYAYDDNIFIYSNGQQLDIREVSGLDELTVRGYNKKVLSVVVDKGHGYIKLINEDNYIDGLIEIGNTIITKVTKDMIIAAPEGDYVVTVTKNGLGGEKNVTVVRDQECYISFSDFEQPVERVGSVNFIVTPSDADAILYVDGVITDYKDLVRMSYGDHRIVLKSNNYDTFTKDITITSAYSTINVDMSGEEETSEEKETSEKETTKENEKETTEKLDEGDEVIRVTSPDGASVYFDGVYKGVAPVEFKKQAGEHVIILRMDGYETKMYTIDVVSDGEDMEISFPKMLESD